MKQLLRAASVLRSSEKPETARAFPKPRVKPTGALPGGLPKNKHMATLLITGSGG